MSSLNEQLRNTGCGRPGCCHCGKSGVGDAKKVALGATDALLLEHGLARVPIPADGNCMFHAIAAFFRHRAVTHMTVRRLIVDYIVENADLFRVDIECDWPSLEHYCRAMRMPCTWGDAIALSAFCMSQNVNIVVFGERGFSELYPGDNRVKLAVVRVGEHYDATRVLTTRQKTLLQQSQYRPEATTVVRVDSPQ